MNKLLLFYYLGKSMNEWIEINKLIRKIIICISIILIILAIHFSIKLFQF